MFGLKEEILVGDTVYWVGYDVGYRVLSGKVVGYGERTFSVRPSEGVYRVQGVDRNIVHKSRDDARIDYLDQKIKQYDNEIEHLRCQINECKEEKEELLVKKLAGI